MKKKIFSIAIVAAIALGAGWNVMQSENETDLSDLALSNVEALANSEELPEIIVECGSNEGRCWGLDYIDPFGYIACRRTDNPQNNCTFGYLWN